MTTTAPAPTTAQRSSAAPPARRRSTRTLRYGARTRKLLLLAHIVSAGAWIGLDVVMGTLALTGVLADSSQTRAVALQAIELFAVWPMATLALLTLTTGVLLGLGTKYGLVRYWWVLVKLVMNIVLALLVLLSLRGGVHELADRALRLQEGEVVAVPLGDMAYPPVVSTTALLVASVLSVFKPWGRTRRR